MNASVPAAALTSTTIISNHITQFNLTVRNPMVPNGNG